MNFVDSIAAISTAPGIGALALVRLSGPQALTIGRSIFRSPKINSADLGDSPDFKSHSAMHGFVVDPASQDVIDEVMLTYFQGPKSFTGEDLVEITCHGNPVVAHEILSLMLRLGARLARKGEFTERAFLNGRIDLTQAEAVLDIIQAKTVRQGRRALSALTGALGSTINSVRMELVEILTRIVAGIDFPDEIGDAPEPEVEAVVRRARQKLAALLATAKSGRFLREGLKLSIVGRPNAGKSSLLNQFLKFERAIVTDHPGTTRDSLEEMLDINGVPVILIDTAGIRATSNEVEQLGIARTKKAMLESDLILLLFDLQVGWSEPEEEIQKLLADKPFVVLGNKMDLWAESDVDRSIATSTKLPDFNGNPLCLSQLLISAKTGQHMEKLNQLIEKFALGEEAEAKGPSLNSRQTELCLKASQALLLVENTLKSGYPQDCLATDLKSAVDALSEISGETVSEEIIARVFASFCIGK